MKSFFLGLLKRIGVVALEAAPVAASAINPVLGPLVQTLANQILVAEQQHGSGSGPTKQQQVAAAVDGMAPMILASLTGMAGKQIQDSDQFAQGLSKIQEGLVDIFNATGVLPGKAK